MTESKRTQIALDEAIKRLPAGDTVHTYRQCGPCLIGADWERDLLIEAMRMAKAIEVTGPQAQAMNHGLAIFDKYGWLFIETVFGGVISPAQWENVNIEFSCPKCEKDFRLVKIEY